jgi:hypothetical protein
MATADAKQGERNTTTSEDRHLGVLLACFAEPKTAGKAHGPLEKHSGPVAIRSWTRPWSR